MKFHFNLIAPLYEKVFGQNLATDWSTLLDIKHPGILLDAGGGTGRISKVILKLHPDMRVVVADESAGMLKEAARTNLFHTVLCKTEDLPFKQEGFSRIVMVDAFHHVKDHRKTLNEMWRVLDQDGLAVIEEPDIQKPFVMLLAAAEKLLLMRSKFLSSQAIKKLLPVSAIIDVTETNSNFWFRFRKSSSV